MSSPGNTHTLGGFRLLRPLAKGGMSSVYLACRPDNGELVALKVLSDALSSDPLFAERFHREAELALAVHHPNLVGAAASGVDDATGRLFIAFEYVPGPTACSYSSSHAGKLPVGDAIHIATEVARALEWLHVRNLVHRDIKPGNILLSPSGRARLIDLGLARRLDDDGPPLTATGQGFGTSYYMPYEQAVNAHIVDGRSDVFALGATLYHLLTGQVPFTGENHSEVVRRKAEGHYKPARSLAPELPPVIDAILARMLARDPRQRFATASEVVVALERTRLAAAMPSYADPHEALRDPSTRARLTTDAQPTRPDLEAIAPADQHDWLLRWPKGADWTEKQLATAQVLALARAGRLPPDTRAARRDGGVFRPLHAYPEFQEALADAAAERPHPVTRPSTRLLVPHQPKRWPMLLCVGIALGASAAVGWLALRG